MSRLFLLRHAKAGWAQPGMRDFDRPLETSGIADAKLAGMAMQEARYVPDVTLCSSARRARETLEAIAEHADTGRVFFRDDLYTADASGYLAIIRENGAHGPLLVIGHNPMLEDLAMALSADGDASARQILNMGFPTSGLAVIRFAQGLDRASTGDGFLEAFLAPAAV